MLVKTAIVLDNLGTFHETPEDERDEILKNLKEDHKLDVRLDFFGHLFHELPAEKEFDLVIVDYGALWQVDMSNESRLVVDWAQNHPGSLVMLWSTMTADTIVNDVLSPFDESTGWYKKPEWPTNLRSLYENHDKHHYENEHDDAKCRTTVGTHINSNTYMECTCKCHTPEVDDWLNESIKMLESWFK